ncbi:MAG: transposase, partial [Burkholderiaceae bacterium]|nr:transposase [Burkholderiaceae bacterium]
MARLPRVAAGGYPHHVLQRGINRQPIFHAPGDYRRFLDCVAEQLSVCEVAVHAYVLMPNHVHLLVT